MNNDKTKFYTYVKLVLISDTYCILILHTPNATARKRNKLTRGTSLDRVDPELVKRLSDCAGNWKVTKDSHVTSQTWSKEVPRVSSFLFRAVALGVSKISMQ